jgi:hypothetical protein
MKKQTKNPQQSLWIAFPLAWFCAAAVFDWWLGGLAIYRHGLEGGRDQAARLCRAK